MKNIHLIKEEYIKCGDCNKHYLCTTCGAQCGSEGHFIESTKQKQCDCTDKCLGYLTKTCTRKQEQKQHLIDIMRCDEELGLYKEPKEKAKQLFDKFYYVKDEQGFHSVNKYRAKQCASIAVDELIDENEYLEEMVQAGLKKQFWEKVKQEIEKL